MVTLQDFLNKVREKEEKKVKIAIIDIEGIGEVEFQRPKEADLLKYNNGLIKCYRGNLKDRDNISTEDLDMEEMAYIASELIYNSCSFFRSKELRAMYQEYEFIDIPLIILGFNETLRVANKVNSIFKGLELKKETDEDIKN